MLARSQWGKGFATEGARAALEFAFNKLNRSEVLSIIRPANSASIRVAERIGERFDRTITFKDEEASVYHIDRRSWESR